MCEGILSETLRSLIGATSHNASFPRIDIDATQVTLYCCWGRGVAIARGFFSRVFIVLLITSKLSTGSHGQLDATVCVVCVVLSTTPFTKIFDLSAAL